jgi:hypothetical protein
MILLKSAPTPENLLGSLRIVPKIWSNRLLLKTRNLLSWASFVKDNSANRLSVSQDPDTYEYVLRL